MIVTLCGLLLFGSKKTDDLIGKTREDILILLEKYPRTDWNGSMKILIGYNSKWNYYDCIDEIKKDVQIMKASYWEIFRKKSFMGWKYTKIDFNNNIVVYQNIIKINDAM